MNDLILIKLSIQSGLTNLMLVKKMLESIAPRIENDSLYK